jgi:hypothetical protein
MHVIKVAELSLFENTEFSLQHRDFIVAVNVT